MKYFVNILRIFKRYLKRKNILKIFFHARWRPWTNNNPWLEDQNNNDSSAKWGKTKSTFDLDFWFWENQYLFSFVFFSFSHKRKKWKIYQGFWFFILRKPKFNFNLPSCFWPWYFKQKTAEWDLISFYLFCVVGNQKIWHKFRHQELASDLYSRYDVLHCFRTLIFPQSIMSSAL